MQKWIFLILICLSNNLSFGQNFVQEIKAIAADYDIEIQDYQNGTTADILFNFAFDFKYGHIPTNLEFNGLDESIDSLLIQSWVEVVLESKNPKSMLSLLEPSILEYTLSKNFKNHPDYSKLKEFQNFFRWLQRYSAEQFILINIAANELLMYQNGSLAFQMKIITGTRSNKTPIMATIADAAIVYPYWTPTRNIATQEILPKIKEDSGYLRRNNFEVLNTQLEILDANNINWDSLNAENFNYIFRQGTGCDNALGLLKINIQNPNSIYLHDTPHNDFNLSLFTEERRHFSHGCIRLEKPLELVQRLNPMEAIDAALLATCLENQEPQIIDLEKDIPVFIMYFTDYIDNNGVWKTKDDYYEFN